MSRLVVLLLALTLLLPAPAALAQQGGGAFDPLPPSQPTPVPTVAAQDDPTDDEDVGRTTLYVIGGLLVLAFAGLAVWITRDARRAVPDEGRQAAVDPDVLDERRHKMAREAKEKARKKARAQRAARRRNRR